MILLVFSCQSVRRNESKLADKVLVYSLPSQSLSPVAVNCTQITKRSDVKHQVITDEKEIMRFYKVFFDITNFELDSSASFLDSKIRIDFQLKGEYVRTFCWSKTKRISFGDGVYRYSKKVEDFLLAKELIIVYKFPNGNNPTRADIDSTKVDQFIKKE